jgi:hypothetical protein
VKEIFKFPRIKGTFDINDQFSKISQEFSEYAEDYEKTPNNPHAWLNRFLDLAHAVEMTERVLRDKGINVDAEYYSIIKENQRRGLYS